MAREDVLKGQIQKPLRRTKLRVAF